MQEITSRRNPQIQHLKKLGADRAYRDACGEFLCDGFKLYQEALQWGMEITLLATSQREIGESFAGQAILVPEDVLHSISPIKSPQPLIFACKKPHLGLAESPDTVLILDGIQDPGNAGTMIRSAGAFAVDQVILTGGSADIYNPKTIRAAMGAVFHQRAQEMTLDELIYYVNQNDLRLIGAALREGGKEASALQPIRAAIAIGSEGRGLSQALLNHCHETVEIPMNPACESLNAGVAGSILLWELYKKKYLQSSTDSI